MVTKSDALVQTDTGLAARCSWCGTVQAINQYARRYKVVTCDHSITEPVVGCVGCAQRTRAPLRSDWQPRCVTCERARKTVTFRAPSLRRGPPTTEAPILKTPHQLAWLMDRVRKDHHWLAQVEQSKPALADLHNARAWVATRVAILRRNLAAASEALAAKTVPDADRQRIQHFVNCATDFFDVVPVAARVSSSSDHLKRLVERHGGLIRMVKRRNGKLPGVGCDARESEDTDQQGLMGMLAACDDWSPNHDKLAKFSTYATWLLRRRIQIRRRSDVAPGYLVLGGGQVVTQKSLESEFRSDAFHPAAPSGNGGLPGGDDLSLDVREALAKLPEDQRTAFLRVALYKEAMHEVAEAMSLSRNRVQRLVTEARAALAEALRA